MLTFVLVFAAGMVVGAVAVFIRLSLPRTLADGATDWRDEALGYEAFIGSSEPGPYMGPAPATGALSSVHSGQRVLSRIHGAGGAGIAIN